MALPTRSPFGSLGVARRGRSQAPRRGDQPAVLLLGVRHPRIPEETTQGRPVNSTEQVRKPATNGKAMKARGSQFERDVARYLAAHGHPYAERAYGAATRRVR